MLRRLVLVAAVVALLPSLVFAQPERKNFQVVQDVAREVNRYTRFTVFDDVSVCGGPRGGHAHRQGDDALQGG